MTDIAGTQGSLAGQSATRLGAEVIAAGASLVVGIATARALGPAGKGTLASILYLGTLLTHVCSLGLGEALTVMAARGEIVVRELAAIALPALALAGLLGSPVLVVLAAALPGRTFSAAVLVAACATMLFTASAHVLGVVAMASGAVSTATAGHLIRQVGTLLVVAVLLAFGALTLTGATAAAAVGSLAAAGLVLLLLRRSGSALRPRWRPSILTKALRFGVVAQLGYLLVALAQRADQLLVFRLSGPHDAGRYSVALTLSQLVAYGAVALSTVSFARIAYAADGAWQRLLVVMARRSLAASILATAAFVAIMPTAIPLLFGRDFGPAVAPALLLLPGAVAGGLQWVLCRALLARGRQSAMLFSFASTPVLMVVLDLFVIGRHGVQGAAVVSSFATAVGVVVAVGLLKDDLKGRELLPRPDDFVATIKSPLRLARRGS